MTEGETKGMPFGLKLPSSTQIVEEVKKAVAQAAVLFRSEGERDPPRVTRFWFAPS